jgi:uncharacterized protein
MRAHSVSLEPIEDFLAQKRIAIVGVSRDPSDFSMSLFDELSRRGYDIVPVNPKIPSVKGRRCFARVQDIQPPVSAALLMTTPEVSETIVSDCAEAGIRRIWMFRATGKGAVSERAVALCKANAIAVIPGQCPFMFLPGAGGVHRLHGLFRKITGRYPHRAVAA